MNLENARWMISSSPDGAILINRSQTIVAANQKAADLFATRIESLEGAPLGTLIPEDSVPGHHEYVANFFDHPKPRSMGTGARFTGRLSDGSVLPVDIMLNQIKIGSTLYAMAVIRDDSERATIESVKKQLEAANMRLMKAQEAGGLAWWEMNLNTNQMVWSDTMPRIVGINDDASPSLNALSQSCLPEDRSLFDAIHQNPSSSAGRTTTFRVRDSHGAIRWMEETIHAEAEDVVLGVIRDVSDQKALEEKLRSESVTDDLTRLFNRKKFNQDLKRYYAEFVRSKRNASVIMYDFDHFKNVNDLYGHAMGDQVLSRAAQLVTQQLRPSDHAYRLGGEEFAILLSGSSTEDARILADRVRRTIETARFALGDAKVSVTVSFGIAKFRSSDQHYEDALNRADNALYQSKANVRNTISILE
ncbi:hypothetical protein CLH62_20335 [Marinobacter guineae]|uniref:diguanylate cyclase n=2 Tax=Marinobacter guineae TaxID=432303 RepID=A0A2G1VAC8_9GAMM|nr:hypothetical protein CLH62_20335 [Marinobacter guineae]